MIAALVLEAIGDDMEHLFKHHRLLRGEKRPFDYPWVARCTGWRGAEPVRDYITGLKDYTRGNSVGSRGITLTYWLQEGEIYEAHELLTWKRSRQYFCHVVDGHVVEMERDIARGHLQSATTTGGADVESQQIIVQQVTTLERGERVRAYTPYHPGFPPRAKQLGGKWVPPIKPHHIAGYWDFDPRDEERVRDLVRDLFGTDGSDRPDLVTLRLTLSGTINTGSLWLAGRLVVERRESRYQPDQTTLRFGDGVVLIAGEFEESSNYWSPTIGKVEGIELEIRDVPRPLAERGVAASRPSRQVSILEDAPRANVVPFGLVRRAQ